MFGWLFAGWFGFFDCLFCFVFDNLEGQMVTNSCHIPQASHLDFSYLMASLVSHELSPYNSDWAGISSQMRSRKWFGTVGVWFLDFCSLFYNKWKAFVPQKNVMLLNIGRNLSFVGGVGRLVGWLVGCRTGDQI